MNSHALRSTRLVDADGGERPGIVVWQGGHITEILPYEASPAHCLLEDVGDRVVMPGLVDSHVHINEPGRTEWEGFDTATRAAASGGITTLVDMPLNCIPVTTSVAALDAKLAATPNQLWVDCGFYGGVVPGNTDQLAPLIAAGVLGFKAFLTHSGIDDFPNVTEADLRLAMPILARHNIPLLVHAELESPVDVAGEPNQYGTYLASRPGQWEIDAIALMIRLARETGCPTHIVHLSCADALPILAEARATGVPITVETCPHYLCLEAETIPAGQTQFKCAPPIREADNRNRLWQGLKDGIIDFVISDHSPCVPELKKLDTGDFMEAWGGIASLQLGLRLVWTECQRRGFSLVDLTRWMSREPARRVGLGDRKGRLAPGYDADLIVWNPTAADTVAAETLLHRHPVTPYLGHTLYGVVEQTILRGRPVLRHHQWTTPPFGQPILAPKALSLTGDRT
jgi:allantoinase